MWHYRRRRRDLKPEEETELDALFDTIPELQLPYHFREDVAEVFDTAKNRKEASTRLEELREVVASEPDLRDFFDLYDRWRDGILAYFDRRETSAAVEGLNTKARVITRRSYGIKCADIGWGWCGRDQAAARMLVESQRATRYNVGQSIEEPVATSPRVER